MLQVLAAHAIASGIEHVEVVSTIPAKAFYERNGYVSNGAPKHVGRIIGDFPLVEAVPHNTALNLGRNLRWTAIAGTKKHWGQSAILTGIPRFKRKG